MQLTKEDKIEFLKDAIEFFTKYNHAQYGICYRLQVFVFHRKGYTNFLAKEYDYTLIIKTFLPELYIKKPDTIYNYWFSLSTNGHAQRVKLLTEVLNELTNANETTED